MSEERSMEVNIRNMDDLDGQHPNANKQEPTAEEKEKIKIIKRGKWIESHMKKIRYHVEKIRASKHPLSGDIADEIEINHLVNNADAESIVREMLE